MRHAPTAADYDVYVALGAGRLALSALQTPGPATVLGVTSRGLFLRSSSRWITFLSFESYLSPLTITLDGVVQKLQDASVGAPIFMQSGLLLFPAVAVGVRLPSSRSWSPAMPSGNHRSPSEQLNELRTTVQQIDRHGNEGGLGPLLPYLLAMAGETRLAAAQRHMLQLVLKLKEALRRQELVGALDAANGLLGLGPGLTAAGDDFLIGLLLLVNRWCSTNAPGHFLTALNKALVEAAYRKTTTISANLIECATRGEADERLLAMVDGIVRGSPHSASWFPPLSRWGASSGIDALCGAVVAIQLCGSR